MIVMKGQTTSRAALALAMAAVAVMSSALTLALVYIDRPWDGDIAVLEDQLEYEADTRETVLRWDTPVVHEWRDARGDLIGSYTTTLYDYTDDSSAITQLSSFESEMSTLAHFMVTDEEMRGHLLRHGLTEAQLDTIALQFEADPDIEAYMAYHAK